MQIQTITRFDNEDCVKAFLDGVGYGNGSSVDTVGYYYDEAQQKFVAVCVNYDAPPDNALDETIDEMIERSETGRIADALREVIPNLVEYPENEGW